MKKKFRKSLAFLLTLTLVLSLAPAAFAAGTVSQLTPSESAVALYAGGKTTKDSAALDVIVSPADYNGDVVWKSGDPAVAALSAGKLDTVTTQASGGHAGVAVYGLKAGTASVTASAGGKTATFTVTVKANSVSSLKFTDTAGTAVTDVRLVKNSSMPLRVAATYLSGDTEDVTAKTAWSSSDSSVANFDTSGNVISYSKEGTAAVSASMDNLAGGTIAAACKVTVSGTPTLKIDDSTGKYSVSVGGTLTLTAQSNDNIYSKVVWTTGDKSLAMFSNSGVKVETVTGKTAVVTGVAPGSAVITAKYTYTDTDSSGKTVTNTVTDTRTITVTGGPLKTLALSNICVGIGASGTLTATPAPVNPEYKSAAWTISDPTVAAVTGAGLAAGVYGRSEGSAIVTVSALNEGSTVPVTASCRVISTNLGSADAAGRAVIGTNMTLADISDMLAAKYNYKNGVAPGSAATITFSSLGSSSCGTLYESSSRMNFFGLVTSGTAYKFSDLAAMAFAPSAGGDYVLPYSISDKTAGLGMSGTITISVGTSSVTANVGLNSGAPYVFSSAATSSGVDAATAIYNAIYSKYAVKCDHIVLDTSVSSGSAVGTLYADTAKTDITYANRTFSYTSAVKPVSGLFFVPASTGTYVRSFAAYDYSGAKIADCELRIAVRQNSISMFYNMKPGASISLDQSLFQAWFADSASSAYLSYITLDGVTNSSGAFSCAGTAFTPGTAVKYYSSSYTGTVPTNARYINSVQYKAASSSYSTFVSFTCCGGAAANSTGVTKSGTLAICVTPGAVGNVTYSIKAGGSQTMDSASFTAVYKTAVNVTGNPAFVIKLLGLPASGKLYYGYVSDAVKGTPLTSSNLSNYDLYANNASAPFTIDKLTYVPDSAIGSDSVNYAVYDTGGALLYCGMLLFKNSGGNFDIYDEGYTFSVSDFYSASSADPIMSVKFGLPGYGKFYYNYANGSGTAVTTAMNFYTNTARTGENSITKLTYIPAAGRFGSDSISYTAVTKSGAVKTGTIVINVRAKTASTRFSDVTAENTGSWSANAVDFCAAWNIVSGTGPSTFSPDDNMKRADLVSILYSAAGKPAVTGTNKFKDVKSGDYYYNAVLWASKNNIVGGTGAAAFSPEDNVTREQIAAILYKFAVYSGASVTASADLSGYSDRGSIDDYALTPMKWAVASGIISGTTAATLSPLGNATRAQVVVMLHGYLT